MFCGDRDSRNWSRLGYVMCAYRLLWTSPIVSRQLSILKAIFLINRHRSLSGNNLHFAWARFRGSASRTWKLAAKDLLEIHVGGCFGGSCSNAISAVAMLL